MRQSISAEETARRERLAFLKPRCELIQSNDLVSWNVFLRQNYGRGWNEMEGVETLRHELQQFSVQDLLDARCPSEEIAKIEQERAKVTQEETAQPRKGACRRAPDVLLPAGSRVSRDELVRRLALECNEVDISHLPELSVAHGQKDYRIILTPVVGSESQFTVTAVQPK